MQPAPRKCGKVAREAKETPPASTVRSAIVHFCSCWNCAAARLVDCDDCDLQAAWRAAPHALSVDCCVRYPSIQKCTAYAFPWRKWLCTKPIHGTHGHLDRLDRHGVAQAPGQLSPAHHRDCPKRGSSEAGIGDKNRAGFIGKRAGRALQALLLGLKRTLLAGRKHHLKDWQCATTHRYRRMQQMPAAIGVQVGPIDHNHRSFAARQPLHHYCVDRPALGMKMATAPQTIEWVKRNAHTLSMWPRSSQIRSA
jgi:hypothetical protein